MPTTVLRLLSVFLIGWAQILVHTPPAMAADSRLPPVLAFSFSALSGGTIDLKDYAGRALLIVTLPSSCGFGPQIAQLAHLQGLYAKRGFTVIGIPAVSPVPADAMPTASSVCPALSRLPFPVAARTRTGGETAHPFFLYVTQKFGPASEAKWQFQEYLIDARGSLTSWFPPGTAPDSPTVMRAIERALPLAGDPLPAVPGQPVR